MLLLMMMMQVRRSIIMYARGCVDALVCACVSECTCVRLSASLRVVCGGEGGDGGVEGGRLRTGTERLCDDGK